nr:cation:proton antiporter [Candidatus Omnitrophota bacterium]
MPDLTTLLHFLVQILTLWLCALTLGLAAQKTGLPAMAGEITAGLLLGPSCLGFFLPGLFEALFQAAAAAAELRQYSVKFALLCFLFYAGLETGLHSLKNVSRPAIVVGAAGMAVPFAAGLFAVFAAPAW